jgi:RimJ/RimL family protein N-acetyltransferase
LIPLSIVIDARHYSACETLRNGWQIQIRSMRPDDLPRIELAFGKLEQESIHARFFGAKSGLTDADRRTIMEMDFDTRVALVITLAEEGQETIIASGSYSRFGNDVAEVAFIVEEDYHGQGIARRLLWHLAFIARECGITRFEAEVLPFNTAMLRVFAASGLPMKARREDGVVHVSLDLRVGTRQDAA